MLLFEPKLRIDQSYGKNVDNSYSFYDRSALPESGKVRDLLNCWFNNYPNREKSELKARFKDSFSSVFFELFLHEFFLRQGFKLQPHPNLENTDKHPDFLVTGNGFDFYLEAKESSGKSKTESAFENRLNSLKDEINKVNSPFFFLNIEQPRFKSQKQPSGKLIIKFIEQKLQSFDPDEIENHIRLKGFEKKEKLKYEDDDVCLNFSFFLKPKELRGVQGIRPTGIFSGSLRWGGSDVSIKSNIEKKAYHYGNMNKPFLICINSVGNLGIDFNDVSNALFGSQQILYSTDPGNPDVRLVRGNDGLFGDPKNPKHTRVSAVFVTNVNCSNLSVAKYWFVKHPFAKYDLSFDSSYLSIATAVDNYIDTKDGKTIKEIMGIENNWPFNN